MEAVPVLIEQRFPLKLSEEIPALRQLYEESKQARWDPRRQVPWGELGAGSLSTAHRTAAAATWRRRAWIEAGALMETPALVVRFCMEKGREAETHMFLTVRNAEEAWHVEACDTLARALAPEGARPPARPGTDAHAALFNRNLYRTTFDARTQLDALVAVYGLWEDLLEAALAAAHRANTTNPAIIAVLDRMVATKTRHTRFGRIYLAHRAPGWSDGERAGIAETLRRHIEDIEFAGYHLPWLAANSAAAEAAADATTAAAGLGAATPEAEAQAFRDALAELRAVLAPLGVTLPPLHHPLLGEA